MGIGSSCERRVQTLDLLPVEMFDLKVRRPRSWYERGFITAFTSLRVRRWRAGKLGGESDGSQPEY